MSKLSSEILAEKSPLLKLKDRLSDAQYSTRKMLSKLEKFEKRLGNLDSQITGIQTTTDDYSRARENIRLVLCEANKTRDYFDVAKEIESTLKGKFSNNPQAYFTAIERLTHAKKFFQDNAKDIKASGQALKSVDPQLKKCIAVCCEELEKLFSHKRSESNSEEGSVRSGEASLKDAKAICNCLESNDIREQYDLYKQVRVAQATIELDESETTLINDWNNLLQDIPYQKGSHPLKDYASQAHQTIKNELYLW
eukprot:CAMPEP_0119038776 /NCGR_PEP_ID=MMETSP1177-20130426/7897_1 /TAXON_ID=2985 /ORGANISM="Ochromonas sp, Strain CCMP1899" /LENGTH=252 /DNA_ID=CAMNT_0007001797 /DNA_START=298 /DNA_END=1053 /DNA_ORIENTATION=+